MSWQLGAFTILAIALAGGFAWYERSKPDARIVALVGTLAAFAALGRIAFAALPNVKPTTDIVLISGYALGGAPGFVVGALAGLTSNFFFGQGPWTPWQMAAWGATGVLGAGLAIATSRRIGRWSLALVCALAGFAFAAVQDVGDWVTYSDHSLAQLGVYLGKGIGFDTVHAVGCLLFALALGPPLVRSIARFAARLQVTWRTLPGPAAGALAIALAVGLSVAAPARAAGSPSDYLRTAQNADGGLGPAPGSPSSELFSGWAALGLAATGSNPQDVRHGGASLIDYIRSATPPDVGSLERTILVLRAAGLDASSLLASLERDVRPDGSLAHQVNLTSFAVLAERAGGATPAAATLAWLARQQDPDGGFNFATAGGASDIDDTGAALEAIGANGRAVAFLRRQQNSDGGWPSQPGADSNAQSSSWAIQGLLAAGVNDSSVGRGLGYLSSLIAPDGHVRYSRTSDQTPVWVTGEAVMALARKPLPLAPIVSPGSTVAPRPVTVHRRASARRHQPAAKRTAIRTPQLLGFATDVALVTALALAPIGLG